MNKHFEKIKKNAVTEAKKSSLVILGAVGGLLLAKGIRKFTADNPTLDAVAQYGLPVLYGGGGFLITTMTEEKSNLKYIGYGLMVAGAIDGVKLIPVAKDFLSGILGDTEIPAANAFYTESAEREAIMSGFGLSALPVGKASMQDAQMYETSLPELEGAENQNDDLGYSSSVTDDSDQFRGIL